METEVTTPTSDQELKLTSNIFSTDRGSKFKVTVESVLIGEASCTVGNRVLL